MENPPKLNEQKLEQALLESAIAQGKYEMSSDILHNIGNAIVGFGSYLTRIRRCLEQDNTGNLKNLAEFFTMQQNAMSTAIGEAKAGALVSMLNSILETQKAGHDEIQRSVTEQLGIITHIQEILNIQRQYVLGQESGEKSQVNLRTIINDCLSMLLASIDKRGIILSMNISVELPPVKGDKTRLMQVIINILKNSIEAIDIQAIEKKIDIQTQVSEHKLILEIKDSGCGFDHSTERRLFERGFTTKTSGTGLGLSSCRSVVEGHGGTIQITSEGAGKGAITSIEFSI